MMVAQCMIWNVGVMIFRVFWGDKYFVVRSEILGLIKD